MDRFLKRPAESPARSPAPAKRTKPSELSRQGNVSAADRAAQYDKGVFYAENELMYCRVCNTVIEHVRKDTVNKHLTRKVHLEKVQRAKAAEENRRLRMQSMATVIQHFPGVQHST